jgi:hypothetical protein
VPGVPGELKEIMRLWEIMAWLGRLNQKLWRNEKIKKSKRGPSPFEHAIRCPDNMLRQSDRVIAEMIKERDWKKI